MRLFILLLAGLVMAGCQTTSDLDGSGPITLSTENRVMFDRYMKERRPLAFAIAIDGRSGASYRYCPDIACGSETTSPFKAIKSCERRSNGVPCKLFARKHEIVWQGYTGDAGTGIAHVNWKEHIGDGLINLDHAQRRGLKEYLSKKLERSPYGVFVASTKGGWAWAWQNSTRDAAKYAIDICNRQKLGNCQIFAVGRELAWTGSGYESLDGFY